MNRRLYGYDNFSIDKMCKEFGIINWSVNFDGTIDVNDDVVISHKPHLTNLPLKFGKVSGFFTCYNTGITSLEGSPIEVEGSFNFTNCNLVNLIGAPKKVGGNFKVQENMLTSLEGGPKEVGGNYYCHENNLTSLEGCPEVVGGSFLCHRNSINTLKWMPKKIDGEFDCRYNKLTSIEGCTSDVGVLNFGRNKIKNFKGFPEFYENSFSFDHNPTQVILNMFPGKYWLKAIYFINEYDALDEDGNIIEERLDEVYHTLGLKYKHYGKE